MKILPAVILLIATTVLAEYPVNFPKCHYGDTECITKATNEVIRKYFSGLRDVNLISFEPLHVKSMVLERNPEGPVNVELAFRDLDFFGLKSAKVTSATGFQADLSGRNSFEGIIPELHAKGFYKIDGRVLVLPIVGEGAFDLIIKNAKFKFAFDLKPVDKNGEIYATLEHIKYDLDLDHMHFQFDNLFNGNKELGDNMNKFVNDNWRDIYVELKPSLTKALSLIHKSICVHFFDKHPYAEHFL